MYVCLLSHIITSLSLVFLTSIFYDVCAGVDLKPTSCYLLIDDSVLPRARVKTGPCTGVQSEVGEFCLQRWEPKHVRGYSGGQAMASHGGRWLVHGIISASSTAECTQNKYNVLTDVRHSDYVLWISNQISQDERG